MPEKDTLKPQVMAGIFSLVQRMEEVDGLFDKVGFTLVEEGLGGLILTELHFLALIAAEGAVNGATAARKLRMTRGGVSKMAARLQVAGFIQTRTLPGDRKSRHYTLTPKGWHAARIHQTLHALAEDMLWTRLKACSETELALFVRMLERVSEALSASNRPILANAATLLQADAAMRGADRREKEAP